MTKKKKNNGKPQLIIGSILTLFALISGYIAFILKSGTAYDLMIEVTSGFLQLIIIFIAVIGLPLLGVGVTKFFNKIK